MKVNTEKLLSMAVEENEEERKYADDLRENGSLYKASMRIALKIKRALKEKGWTQNQFASKMKVDPATISRYLSGKSNFELKTLIRFEELLGINIINRSISSYSDQNGKPINQPQTITEEKFLFATNLLASVPKRKDYSEIFHSREIKDMVREDFVEYNNTPKPSCENEASPMNEQSEAYQEGYVIGYKEGYVIGYKEGYAKGYAEGLRFCARNMLKAKFHPNLIHELTELPLDDILSLKQDTNYS